MEEPETLWPPTPKHKEIAWPDDIRPPLANDTCALALIRKLDPCAFHTAGLLGTLKIATHKAHWSWIITDRAASGAEARRMDAQLWDGAKKSLALAGSRKNAPIGLVTFNSRFDALKNIVLVEGAPDYYAALALAVESPINFRPAAMLGASCSIEVDPGKEVGTPGSELAGSTVLVLPHADEPGSRAALRWRENLRRLGAMQVIIQPLPDGFKDLNELVSVNPNEAQNLLQWLSHPRSQTTQPSQTGPLL